MIEIGTIVIKVQVVPDEARDRLLKAADRLVEECHNGGIGSTWGKPSDVAIAELRDAVAAAKQTEPRFEIED